MPVACPNCRKLVSENALTCPGCGEQSAGAQGLAIKDALRKDEIIDFLCHEDVLHRFTFRFHITLTLGKDIPEYWNEVNEARLKRAQMVWRILLDMDPDAEDFPSLISYKQPYRNRRDIVFQTLKVINTIITDEDNPTAAAMVSQQINTCFRHMCNELNFDHFRLDDLSFVEPIPEIFRNT